MLVELEQFYSRRDEDGNSEVAEILKRYLEPFERDNPQLFQFDVIRPLYEAFQQHGHNAIWRLIDRRADHGPLSSAPPPGPVPGGSSEGQ